MFLDQLILLHTVLEDLPVGLWHTLVMLWTIHCHCWVSLCCSVAPSLLFGTWWKATVNYIHDCSSGTVMIRCSESHWRTSIMVLHLKPQSPQAAVCCKVGAAALVHLRPVLGSCTILPFKLKQERISLRSFRLCCTRYEINGCLCTCTRCMFVTLLWMQSTLSHTVFLTHLYLVPIVTCSHYKLYGDICDTECCDGIEVRCCIISNNFNLNSILAWLPGPKQSFVKAKSACFLSSYFVPTVVCCYGHLTGADWCEYHRATWACIGIEQKKAQRFLYFANSRWLWHVLF